MLTKTVVHRNGFIGAPHNMHALFHTVIMEYGTQHRKSYTIGYRCFNKISQTLNNHKIHNHFCL